MRAAARETLPPTEESFDAVEPVLVVAPADGAHPSGRALTRRTRRTGELGDGPAEQVVTAGRLALVTGASGGIGAEFARQLVGDHDLLLVSRSQQKLEAMASSLPSSGSDVSVLAADLSTDDGVSAVIRHLADTGAAVDLLVNNAGSGKHGPFLDTAEADLLEQVQLDVTAVVRLTRAVLPAMITAGRGGVINLASTAGFQPTPGLSTYAASKAFVLSLSEALAVETRGTGVTITAVAPGTVATDFFANAGATFEVGGMLTAEAVVRAALRGCSRGDSLVVPGLRNRLGTVGPRLIPRRAMARAAGWAARAR